MAMVFAWIKNQRRKKLLSEPFPGGWRTFLHANVRHYQHLDARQRMAVEQVVQVSGAEKGAEKVSGTVPLLLGTPAGTTCALQSKPSHDSVGRRPLVLVFPYRENIQIILSCQDQRFLTPFLVPPTCGTARYVLEWQREPRQWAISGPGG